mmetsp:Transcript_22248/g.36137  ORF Transcript_22248/g.36137 Transcript_22248/m.36137 type:complete len:220 (+) Transcript_22248:89-748(+)
MQAFIVFLTCAILQLSGVVDGALSTIIESGEEECYVTYAPTGETSTISGNYECLDDLIPSDPMGVILYDQKMAPVWRSQQGASEGTFSIYGSGKYELCFQNGRAGSDDYFAPQDGIDREVGFALRVVLPNRALGDKEVGPDNRLTSNLLRLSDKLMEGMQTMADHQEYMREREIRHTRLADTTFSRVVQWTVLEAIVLVLISCGQVLYLKKFFEQRRYL